MAQLGKGPPLLVGRGRISPRIGGSCKEREGQSYQWPEERERYSRYRVFMGVTRAEGAVHIGLGETIRKNKWGARPKVRRRLPEQWIPAAAASRVRRS